MNAFFESQLAEWEFARRNFEALRRIETKTFDLDGFSIRVQFNPAPDRFVGRKGRCGVRRCPKMFFMSGKSTARTAGITLGGRLSGIGKSVSDFRPAFYDPCGGTRAAVDRGSLGDMLALARCFDREVVFYNGPRCGASAPDHAHFQAVGKGAMPLEAEIGRFATEKVLEASGAAAYAIRDYLRGGFVIRSADASAAAACFGKLYEALEVLPADVEPMMNVLTWYDSDGWTSCVFPRTKHRPACFYGEGATDLLVSPASVDLAGV